MLLTPRTFDLARTPDKGKILPGSPFLRSALTWDEQLAKQQHREKMLLIHQVGSVKVGELVRYTLTYTPSADRILPSPSYLHVKIKNTSAIPLRAAYLHGPYTVHVAAYPSTFTPNRKVENPRREGVPHFEPNLKAGGSWTCRLVVPEDMRESGAREAIQNGEEEPKSVTWIIEVTSQIIFSSSASVHFELLVGRDEKSLDMGFAAITGQGHGAPGQLRDHQQSGHGIDRHHPSNSKGVFSKAIRLVVDDTTSLWNTPELPKCEHDSENETQRHNSAQRVPSSNPEAPGKRKRVHLVVLTHGLHSNLGADMLYLKESIDATAKQARQAPRERRKTETKNGKKEASVGDRYGSDTPQGTSTAPLSGGQEDVDEDVDGNNDDEEVVVRGFTGNAIKTERGIQYLGKRLARFVLELTYPDQSFLPVKTSMSKKLSNSLSTSTREKTKPEGIPAHAGSTIHKHDHKIERCGYTYTSISFIGHSLGGLVQTYAIAYIYKHSPEFFEKIKPINFIALATPFLGLSNENPMYVKFALDFGLVGRTGQDLGLTWRGPAIARSGWSAMVSGLGTKSKEQRQPDPRSKPLLRILPTGPAHQVLRMFRNRTLYSNVVNDGIVPLRTSCLLFLDWRGLEKVEKARRENGLIGTMMGWGWAEMMGQNSSPNPSRLSLSVADNESRVSSDGTTTPTLTEHDTTVPQPSDDASIADDESQIAAGPSEHQFLRQQGDGTLLSQKTESTSTLDGFFNFFRPGSAISSKDSKMYRRSQTIKSSTDDATSNDSQSPHLSSPDSAKRPRATRGDSVLGDPSNPHAPPRTNFFESAADLLNPPIPDMNFIIDPSKRPRTIFHDRVYHPEDIPPPPAKRPSRLGRSFSSDVSTSTSSAHSEDSVGNGDSGGMRVEEKIARAYHKDLSWRKVLVRLEPDAHNNLIVRRMFANAYGWPVVKHLCDTHFADTYAARTRDELEPSMDRVKGVEAGVGKGGEKVEGQTERNSPKRTDSEMRELADELAPLRNSREETGSGSARHSLRREDSSVWDDDYFEGTSDEDTEEDDRGPLSKYLPIPPKIGKWPAQNSDEGHKGTSEAEIADFLTASPTRVDGHRGLSPSIEQISQPTISTKQTKDEVDQDADEIEPITSTRPEISPSTGGLSEMGITSELGLKKSIEEQIGSPTGSSPSGRQRSGSTGVSEQIARLSTSS
ncbi:DUF676-domain-containing protein [Patellaria atrata CBS 101060]|uniref:DUF676-domain-containing protein n=1 Tax=Patellaria atrata CBS 101060 TaxID=1346257 RepID=A0A9P4SKD8_9PEZI|nr:DUF676-domain-containing protein [Patellaria atrata CBS 101060]